MGWKAHPQEVSRWHASASPETTAKEINGEKARIYELYRRANRLVDMESAMERFQQEAWPEIVAE